MGAILASAVASNAAAIKTSVAGQKRGRASAPKASMGRKKARASIGRAGTGGSCIAAANFENPAWAHKCLVGDPEKGFVRSQYRLVHEMPMSSTTTRNQSRRQ